MTEIDLDYKAGSMSIQYDNTYYCIDVNDQFKFYDNLVVNVSQINDDDYSDEELAGPRFAQPEYAFIIANDTSQIEVTRNVGDMSIKYVSLHHNDNAVIWTECSDDDARQIYDYMINMIKYVFDIQNKCANVFKPKGSWIVYDCVCTSFKNTSEYL